MYRYVVPMKNGDLDSKGILASIVKSDGTIESFKVYIRVFGITNYHVANYLF